MFSYTLVGGTFDENGGKPSGYISKLYEEMSAINPWGQCFNGGTFGQLRDLAFSVGINESCRVHGSEVIFWFPDIPNDKQKLVRDLKIRFPHCYLVTSKNNRDDKYEFRELVARALSVKANLFVEFTGKDRIRASIYDPLGNCFCRNTLLISELAVYLMSRVRELTRFTRVRSRQDSPNIIYPKPDVPGQFFEMVREYADVFHSCIHGMNESRFLGNVSFRCERGFPSFRDENDRNIIWVSQRNIDKRHIEPGGFVPVRFIGKELLYQGEHKPSVDAPIQCLLYGFYPNINYMLHSHTYIRDYEVLDTEKIIPCGALEEFYEIIQRVPDRDIVIAKINLVGHGSLVMASQFEMLENIDYVARTLPEPVF